MAGGAYSKITERQFNPWEPRSRGIAISGSNGPQLRQAGITNPRLGRFGLKFSTGKADLCGHTPSKADVRGDFPIPEIRPCAAAGCWRRFW